LALGCATAPTPALPPRLELGSLLPPPPAPLDVPARVARYDDTHVRRNQCPGLPAGILVSPAVYAEQVYALADRRRLKLEADALSRLHSEQRAAMEQLDAAHRARLAAEQRAVKWQVAVGILAGGLIASVATWLYARPVPR